MNNLENYTKIYKSIKSSSCKDLASDLIEYAVRYARIRVDWLLSGSEQRKEIDNSRTRAHNAFIDSCNILSRNMEKFGEDNSWRTELGNDRKAIGDFACFIHYYLGIKAR